MLLTYPIHFVSSKYLSHFVHFRSHHCHLTQLPLTCGRKSTKTRVGYTDVEKVKLYMQVSEIA